MYKHSVLISEKQIQSRVLELAAKLDQDYEGEVLDILCVLKGALFFVSDLAKQLHTSLRIHFMQARSYGSGVKTGGAVEVQYISLMDVSGKNVLIVEDILDTGITLEYLLEQLQEKNPKTLKSCVLLDKPARRRVNLRADYVGFQIPDHFVIGYGLDYNELGRNLNYIAILDPSEYV